MDRFQTRVLHLGPATTASIRRIPLDDKAQKSNFLFTTEQCGSGDELRGQCSRILLKRKHNLAEGNSSPAATTDAEITVEVNLQHCAGLPRGTGQESLA